MSDRTQQQKRLNIVDEHIAHEVAQRLDPLVATFGDDPEWHDMPAGDVLQGHSAIRAFYAALFAGFPDFGLDVRHRHVAEDAVIVEAELLGTHQGDWTGIPATGKSIRLPLCAVFTFTPDDRLKAEVVYYDRLTILSQLGATGS